MNLAMQSKQASSLIDDMTLTMQSKQSSSLIDDMTLAMQSKQSKQASSLIDENDMTLAMQSNFASKPGLVVVESKSRCISYNQSAMLRESYKQHESAMCQESIVFTDCDHHIAVVCALALDLS
eukprot:GHVL01010838.1.p1 GENE.GHVL01010838.1~~GHVL01010838.1.p1  ORF type:complete len:123 (+),score=30.80 GHVL01010838.1:86-454(+)